jgi:PAS domain S-box-containing protein
MKEIVVVAPFSSMADVTRHVITEFGFANVDILEADPENVLETMRTAIDLGAKVVISRGGFYETIKAAFDIPVVEVKVTAFDLIEIFKEVKQSGERGPISVIGHRNVIYGAEIIAEVMGLQAECVQTIDKDGIAHEVERQIRQGVRTFVGDNNVKAAIDKPNCRVFLVHSGSQAMLTAIQQAEEILLAAREQKEKAQQFATIIDFVHDGIVAIDTQGRITVFNSASEKLTGFSKHDALGKRINEIIPETRLLGILDTEKQVIGDIQWLDNQTVVATNRVPVIVDGEIRGAVATYQDITEVQKLEQKIRIRLSEKGFIAQYTFADIVHRSDTVAACIHNAAKFADYDTSVLICGPSGVGKELFAQGIHNSSPRKNSPFVAINCAALPETLIESELFGYVEGSFTGATRKGKPGLFEMAHGGTIFLDEISELPLLLQGRLLRVLQERQVMRLGDNKLIPVDVRIVCATNRDLRSLVNQNQFRGDLYFRIAILNLYIPPLNERADDIELLSTHFVEEFGQRYRKGRMSLSQEALDFLRHYEFRGNVRELRGMIERAVVICEDRSISVDDLNALPHATASGDTEETAPTFPDGLTLRDMESEYISHVFRKTRGSIKETSAILGIGRTTLWRKIREIQANERDNYQPNAMFRNETLNFNTKHE